MQFSFEVASDCYSCIPGVLLPGTWDRPCGRGELNRAACEAMLLHMCTNGQQRPKSKVHAHACSLHPIFELTRVCLVQS